MIVSLVLIEAVISTLHICVGLVLSIMHFGLYWCHAEFKYTPPS